MFVTQPVVIGMLSEWHVVLGAVIIFLLFGGKKLPELARGIGEAMKEFRKSSRDVQISGSLPEAAKPAAGEPPGTATLPPVETSRN